MSAIPRSVFRARLRRLDHGAFLRLVAALKRAQGWEATVDGATVVTSRAGTERRLLALRPGRFQRIRRAPPSPAAVDQVIAPVPVSGRDELPRGTPSAPIIDADDLREELLYALDPATADRLCESFLGVPARASHWDDGSRSTPWRTAGGVAGIALLLGVFLIVGLAVGIPGIEVPDRHGPPIAETYERPDDGIDPLDEPTVGVEEPIDVADGPTVYISPGQGALQARDAENRDLLWSYRVDGNHILGADRAVDGTIFVASTIGTVHAVDALTGEARWRASVPADRVAEPPTVTDGTVIVRDSQGLLSAFDTTDGDHLWTDEEADTLFGPPQAGDGLAFRYDTDDRLTALELATGEEAWSVAPPANESILFVRPAGGTVYAVTDAHHLLAIDTRTGEERWRFDEDPIVGLQTDDRGAYVLTPDDRLYAVDPEGTERWNWTSPTNASLRAPHLADESLYLVADPGVVVALDRATAEVRWASSTSGDRVVGIGAVDDDRIYVGVDGNAVQAFNRTTGEASWQASYTVGAPYGRPTVVGDTVLVETRERSIHALGGTTGKRAWKFDASADATGVTVATAEDPVTDVQDADAPAPAILNVTGDETVDAGDRLQLSATVANRGASGTVVVEWSVNGEALEPVALSMDAANVTAVTAEVPVPEDPGDLEYTIAVGDESVANTVTVIDPPNFSVAVEPPTAVGPGESATVPVEITNHGDRTGTTPVHLHAGGEVVAETETTVPAGETVALELTVSVPELSELDPRSLAYPFAVTTAHDEAHGTSEVSLRPILPNLDPILVGALVTIVALVIWVRRGEDG